MEISNQAIEIHNEDIEHFELLRESAVAISNIYDILNVNQNIFDIQKQAKLSENNFDDMQDLTYYDFKICDVS